MSGMFDFANRSAALYSWKTSKGEPPAMLTALRRGMERAETLIGSPIDLPAATDGRGWFRDEGGRLGFRGPKAGPSRKDVAIVLGAVCDGLATAVRVARAERDTARADLDAARADLKAAQADLSRSRGADAEARSRAAEARARAARAEASAVQAEERIAEASAVRAEVEASASAA